MIYAPLFSRPTLPRLALIAVLSMLLYAALVDNPAPEIAHNSDKFYHIIAFTALAICTRMAFPRGSLWRQIVAMLALGAAIEVIQYFQSYNVADVWDLVADAIGIGFGLALMRLPPLARCRDWFWHREGTTDTNAA